jgi:hypothetical protein
MWLKYYRPMGTSTSFEDTTELLFLSIFTELNALGIKYQ